MDSVFGEIVEEIKKNIPKKVIIKAGIINDEENAKKALYNEFGTDKIPARPFIRRGLDNIEKELDKKPEQIGSKMVQNIKKAINNSDYPRNAVSTIKKKGFDFPLIDTRDMYNSLTFRVSKED